MITHYLKIGYRNLLKYRQQTVISIVGLSVGFVCFALSTLWIWYENSFDTFHPGSERIYLLGMKNKDDPEGGMSSITPSQAAAHLKKIYPEIEAVCKTTYKLNHKVQFEKGEEVELKTFSVDSGFLDVFGTPIFSKNTQIPFGTVGSIAITDRAVSRFPVDQQANPLTTLTIKDINNNVEAKPVSAIVKSWSPHTNIQFDLLLPLPPEEKPEWNTASAYSFIRLREGVDIASFEKKLSEFSIPVWQHSQFTLMPLKDIHSKVGLYYNRQVQYKYIPLFSWAGLLVICSALFNFLALYISRLQMKGKELVLRKVNGAIDRQLLCQLLVEVAIVLLVVFFFSFFILEWIYPPFESLIGIQLPKKDIFVLLAIAFISLIVLTLLISIIPIVYFKRQTLQQTLCENASGSRRKFFSKISLAIQGIVGIFFLFSTSVIAWQTYHSKTIDLGFDRNELISISYYRPWTEIETETLLTELKKIPAVKSAAASTELFLPQSSFRVAHQKDSRGENVNVEEFDATPEALTLLGIKVIEGRMPEAGECAVLINKSAADRLDSLYRIGSQIDYYSKKAKMIKVPIVGVVQNFQYGHPKREVRPAKLVCDPDNQEIDRIYVKYHQGMRAEVDQDIRTLCKEKMEIDYPYLSYTDDEYNEYFKEDNIILGLLSVLAFVCMLITIFGIYAMISLVCEQQRKEIAIHKINGASIITLLVLFVKEYMLILLGAALIVFPIGYLAMQNWVEQYNNRINIVPIYLLVVASTLLLVGIIIIAWVWKSVHMNPAQELKKE